MLVAAQAGEVREHASRLLGRRYAVEAAADGHAALRAARERPPDLVLIDVTLPGLDGFGLLDAIRADDRLKTVPVIMLAAPGGEEAWVQGMEAGADDYLVQPFSEPELLARVAAQLRMQRSRREAQEALRTSEEKFSTAFAHSPLALTITSLETGRLVEVNDGFLHLTGYTRDEALGRSPDELGLWIDPARRAERFARLRAGQPVADIEARFRLKDGRELVGIIGSAVVDIDGRPCVLSSVLDITDRKRAEEALRDSEERFRLATSAGSVGVWDWNVAADTVVWSDTLYAIHGLAPGSFTGTLDAFAALVHPDDRDAVIAAVQRVLREGAPFAMEFRALRPDGSVVWIYTHAKVLRDETGAVVRVLGATVDVTERKRMEESLREREQRYELVVAGAEAAIWDWDVPSRRVMYSPRWKELRGLAESEVGDGEEEWIERVHPDDRDRVHAALRAHFEGRTAVFAEEYRVRHADGRWIWILDRGIARRDALGRVVRMAGSETDITSRKEAEQSLSESEARFRTIADSAPAMLWVTEADGRCTFLSRGWFDFTGQTAEEDAGFGWLSAVHPEDRPGVTEMFLQATARHEPFSAEYRLRRADGVYRWAIDTGRPRLTDDGRFLGYIGNVIDITERKRREVDTAFLADISEDLARSSDSDEIMRLVAAKLGRHMGVARCLFSEIDTTLKLAHVIHDWTAETQPSLVGTYPLTSLATPEVEAFLSSGQQLVIDNVVTDPRTAPTHELLVRRGVRAYVNTPYVSYGRWTASLSVQRPEPYSWTAEEQALLQDVANRAWARIERASAERRLRESEAQLRRASQMKDEFLATLSHELRTPLNAVVGWTQMLRTGALRPDVVARAFEALERNAKAQSQLVDDLLDMSRIVSGKLHVRNERVDLATVVNAAADTVRPAALAKGVALDLQFEPGAPAALRGDPDRLRQIVWNLLSNAVKFTPGGGAVRVSVRGADQAAVIEVRDTGEGIDPSFLPFVFDRFSQADGTTTRRHGGLGLGLAIVRHLTEAHGGTVAAASAGAGEGAAFTIRLPLGQGESAPPAADAVAALPAASRGDLSGARILVVDDEADARELIGIVLQSAGAEVMLAQSAAEALQRLGEEAFDVLLADIGMPGRDGFSLIRAVRDGNGATARIPAIAVTAYATLGERDRALEAGFDAHLAKPVAPHELVAAVTALARQTGSAAMQPKKRRGSLNAATRAVRRRPAKS